VVSQTDVDFRPALESPKTRFGYNPGLDGLRAIAIAGVLAEHAQWAVPGGYHGVTVFFVISGYLITSLLVSEFARRGTIRFGHFYWRRFARLGPALIVIVVATSIYLLATGVPWRTWWEAALTSLTYTTDLFAYHFVGPAASNNFMFTWSLGIEEQFYLFWPLLLLLLLRWNKFLPTIGLLAVGIVATWLHRDPSLATSPSKSVWQMYDYSPFTHADALLIGCGIALVLMRYPASRVTRIIGHVIGPIGLVFLARIYLADQVPYLPDKYGVSALAAGAVVFWVAASPRGWFSRIVSARPFVFIGKLSYSIYLWNLFFMWIFLTIYDSYPSGVWWGFIWPFVVVGVSYLSYTFVETPLRKRWAPQQSHAVMAPSAPPEDPVVSEDSVSTETTSGVAPAG
jgi:peptidoglycan/LPS O-acetylase OafA/YrhL